MIFIRASRSAGTHGRRPPVSLRGNHRIAVEVGCGQDLQNHRSRKKAEGSLKTDAAHRIWLAVDVGKLADEFVEKLSELLATGDRMSNTALVLGAPAFSYDNRRYVPSVVNFKLHAIAPHDFHYPHPSMRRPLAEIERERLGLLLDREGGEQE
jgi:hypothetical protein